MTAPPPPSVEGRPSKIVSGGQTGADQAGVLYAARVGIETGGWAPKGWLTEAGPARWLGDLGLQEHTSSRYNIRTFANVQDSDGTVVFGDEFSNGSRQTLVYCAGLDRPAIVNPSPEALRHWLRIHNVRTLNVAGNRESKAPGIFARVMRELSAAFGEPTRCARCRGTEFVSTNGIDGWPCPACGPKPVDHGPEPW